MVDLIQDCSCFNPQEDLEAGRRGGLPFHPRLSTRVQHPSCVTRRHTCGKADPLSWGDPDGLEACMRRFVDFGQTACYGDG